MHSKEKEELGEILSSESSDEGKEEDRWRVNGSIGKRRASGDLVSTKTRESVLKMTREDPACSVCSQHSKKDA